MYIELTFSHFRQAFHSMGRGEQFSYDGLEELFNYIEEREQESGEQYSLDVIGLCCEFAEVTPEEFEDDYSGDKDLIIKKLDNGDLLIRQD